MPGFDEILASIQSSGDDGGGTDDLGNNQEWAPEETDDGQDEQGLDQGADNSEETGSTLAFDPSTITDPALLEQYRQMQAGFTPKLQEAAELRRQYGDLEPSVVDAVRTYQQLLKTNPYEARQFLAQQQGWLDEQLGTQQEADPFAGVEPLTPTEEALLNHARQMWQRQQTLELESKQHQFQRRQEQAERQFGQLETAYGTKIPLEEKQQVWAFMQQQGIRDVPTAWKALAFDRAMQAGIKKTAQVKQQKKTQPAAPSNRQARSAPAAPSAKKGVAARFEDAWNQANKG